MTLVRDDIETAVLGRLRQAGRGRAADYVAGARSVLERLAAGPRAFEAAALRRQPGGYARTLLCGDEDVSVWAMVWDAGARTPVHDHHCSCCFALVEGELAELSFRAVDDATAVKVAEARLRAGDVRCMLPSGPNLHQMVNRGGAEAISIHIYGFDHRLMPSSVHREYRVLAQ